MSYPAQQIMPSGLLCGFVAVFLAACGPMSPERAADICEERARAAAGPTAELGLGVGESGTRSSVKIGITSDFLRGRDPLEVYDSCVREKTGQGPIRPLDLG